MDKRFLFLLSATFKSTPDRVFKFYQSSMSNLFDSNSYLLREIKEICNNEDCVKRLTELTKYTHKNMTSFILTSMLTYNDSINFLKKAINTSLNDYNKNPTVQN